MFLALVVVVVVVVVIIVGIRIIHKAGGIRNSPQYNLALKIFLSPRLFIRLSSSSPILRTRLIKLLYIKLFNFF